MRSGGDYSVRRFGGIEVECANRMPLCLTQEVGHAELSLTKGVQHGIIETACCDLVAFARTKP
jgi:hypothetical protein